MNSNICSLLWLKNLNYYHRSYSVCMLFSAQPTRSQYVQTWGKIYLVPEKPKSSVQTKGDCCCGVSKQSC